MTDPDSTFERISRAKDYVDKAGDGLVPLVDYRCRRPHLLAQVYATPEGLLLYPRAQDFQAPVSAATWITAGHSVQLRDELARRGTPIDVRRTRVHVPARLLELVHGDTAVMLGCPCTTAGETIATVRADAEAAQRTPRRRAVQVRLPRALR